MAYVVRHDPRATAKLRIRRVILSIAVLLFAGDQVARRWWPEAARVPLACEVGIVLCVLVLMGLSFVYRCPACRRWLRRASYHFAPGDREGGPIRYICPQCEIEWESGRTWRAHGV